MPLLNFETEINATPEKVWNTLWDEESYKMWAPVLNGLYYEGDFQQDSKIYFFGEDRNGMYNFVEKNIPEKEMKFQHLGWIVDGEESPQNWENSWESYFLEKSPNGTQLKIEVNALDEFADFFSKNYPNMIQKVKELAES